jgi:hypothetical protein
MFLSGIARLLGDFFQCVQVPGSSAGGLDLLKLVTLAFEGKKNFSRGEDEFGRLIRFARDASEDGRKVVLLIDDAHRLSSKPLRQIRLLAGMTPEGRSLVPIVLAGQNPCENILPAAPVHSQAAAARCILPPLTEKETAEYIRHRLRLAGAKTEIFSPGAMAEIFCLSGGIPRLINIICENALLSGHARSVPTIGPGIILDSKGPGHRLIHEICQLDKEFSAKNPAHLPARRSAAPLAIGIRPPENHRPAEGVSRWWQVVLKRLGLRPLTVKGAVIAPIFLTAVVGVFGHFYFSSEYDDPPITHVQLHSKDVPGRRTLRTPDHPLNVPLEIQSVAVVERASTHLERSERQRDSGFLSNEDSMPAGEILGLRDELRRLEQRLQAALDAEALRGQRLDAILDTFSVERNSPEELISEASASGAEIQALRQALETFQRQQLALQKEVGELRNEQADLRKRLMEFSASKTRAITPPDAAKRPLKPKRTVQRP